MPHKYTEEQIEWLRVNYPIYPMKQLHPLFNEHFNINVTISSLQHCLQWRKIKSGRSGCFKKGHIPFNKGVPQNEWLSPENLKKVITYRFSSTDRTKNNANFIEKPVGSERVIDGYIYVKTDTPNNNSSHRWWKFKHHIIWEQYNGPIPKGYKVIFADGNKQNFDINNLILVSDAELVVMNKNKLYFKGNADATKVGHTITKINLRIKEVENGCKEHVK